VVFSAALLSETLFGFALLLALWQLCSAQRANSGPGKRIESARGSNSVSSCDRRGRKINRLPLGPRI